MTDREEEKALLEVLEKKLALLLICAYEQIACLSFNLQTVQQNRIKS